MTTFPILLIRICSKRMTSRLIEKLSRAKMDLLEIDQASLLISSLLGGEL